MTDDRWTSGEAELTGALRAMYAAPTDESYWESLEARILAHVARSGELQGWWSAMADLARPALAAAAILIFVAGAAVMHTRQLEDRDAYTAASENSQRTRAVLDALARLGLSKDQLSTEGFSAY